MSRFVWRVSGFVEILRVHNLLASAMATLLGFEAVHAVISDEIVLNLTLMMLPIAAVILVAAGGYVVNDYYDSEIDAVNKPSRPIPSGRVSKKEALILSLTLMFAGIIISGYVGVFSLAYAIFNGALLVLYSKRLKKEGLIGNLAVGVASANSIIFGGLVLSEIYGDLTLVKYTLVPGTYAFIFTLAREVVKGMEDVAGDKRMGVKTLAAVRGVKYASKVSILLMIMVVLFSPYPYISGIYGTPYLVLASVTDALLIYSVIRLMRASDELDIIKTSSSLRSYTKVAMFLGITAFLADLLIRTL